MIAMSVGGRATTGVRQLPVGPPSRVNMPVGRTCQRLRRLLQSAAGKTRTIAMARRWLAPSRAAKTSSMNWDPRSQATGHPADGMKKQP